MRPVGYRFRKPEGWDSYMQAMIQYKLGVRILGATIRGDEVILFFERELTAEEQRLLSDLMADPPYPEHRFEVKYITEDDIEREIGARPVLLDVDRATGRITRIAFEKRLSPAQVWKLRMLWNRGIRFEEA